MDNEIERILGDLINEGFVRGQKIGCKSNHGDAHLRILCFLTVKGFDYINRKSDWLIKYVANVLGVIAVSLITHYLVFIYVDKPNEVKQPIYQIYDARFIDNIEKYHQLKDPRALLQFLNEKKEGCER